jgi:hypothetical protein
MSSILIVLGFVAFAAIIFVVYQQIMQRREKRILGNEYNAAMTLGNYARSVKNQLDESKKLGAMRIDFQKIPVPPSPGYRVSLEMSGDTFKIHGIPKTHKKTGRLSFYIDNSLTVKASDHGGQYATDKDNEFAAAARG